jgi:Uma2 family endonuclease
LGATRYIARPKQPTISVYQLAEGEYQVSQFRGAERLVSPTFPALALTAEQVLRA